MSLVLLRLSYVPGFALLELSLGPACNLLFKSFQFELENFELERCEARIKKKRRCETRSQKESQKLHM